MPLTLGIDVGGTKIAGGVVDDTGAVVARRRIPTEASDPAAIVAGITKVAAELKAAAPAAVAVGIGAAGLVDVERGIVLSAPNLAWRDVALRAMVSDRVGLPVVVDNDANVAALAEATYGAGKDRGDQVMVNVGTGVGGGVMIRGRLYRGAHGVGGEIGHMIVAGPDGPPCACGNRGCLESVASGTALGRIARDRAREPAGASLLKAAGGDPEAITGVTVGTAALARDATAVAILSEAGRWLGIGLACLANVLDPDLFVVTGGVARSGDLVLGPARAALAENLEGRAWRQPPPVVPGALEPDAGVIGAAVLARDAMG